MTDPLKREETTWEAVRRDHFHVMAPVEFASRKLLFFYQTNAWARVALTLLGGLAVVSTVLSLSQWSDDRKIQKIGLFVQIKEGAEGAAVAALLKDILANGIPPEQVPLAKANLSQSDLSKLNIANAYFKEADLKGAKFQEANLVKVKFIESWLNETDLSKALLDEADFFNSKAAWVNLSKSRLDGARFDHAFMFMANLEGASAKRTRFFRSRLHNANLRGIDATDAIFAQAELGSADFTGARLINVDLSGADLTDAVLEGANVSGAKFEDRDNKGKLRLDENKQPVAAKVSLPQIQRACADESNPPHLPLSDEFKGFVLAKCK